MTYVGYDVKVRTDALQKCMADKRGPMAIKGFVKTLYTTDQLLERSWAGLGTAKVEGRDRKKMTPKKKKIIKCKCFESHPSTIIFKITT